MGKQRRNRRKPIKENPTGIPSVKDLEESTEDIDEQDRREDSALQTVYGQLQSPSLEERLSALRTLESMSSEKAQALEIAKGGTTKIIGALLVDQHTSVRSASASALRRIGENGGDEAYQCLLRDDVMTPLTALLKKYYTDWEPRNDEKGRVNEEKETLIEAITLLWSLCENNECAIKPSNEEKLVSLLIKFLDATTYGSAVSVVAAQCMLTLSEDNPSAIAELKHHESSLYALLELKPKSERESSEVVPLRILASGLLMNINSSEFSREITDDKSTMLMCKVTSVIGETLAIDHVNIVVELASLLPSEKSTLSRNARAKLLAAKKILGAQQQALEILANLSSEEQHDDSSDSDLDDDDDPRESYETELMDVDASAENSCKVIISTLPIPLIEVITSSGLIRNIRGKTLALEKSVSEELNGHSDSKCVAKQVHTLRCRAFMCLNNLMATLDVDTLGGVDQLYSSWLEIGTVIFKDTDQNDIELLESATAAMRAALEKLAEVRANTFQQLTIGDIEPMLTGERQCPNPNVRVNLIRVVGNLALILSNSPTNSKLTKHISTALLDICTKESEVWVMAEALDAIMDIFAEDETDRMAKEIKLVEKLQVLSPVLMHKIRQQRKTLRDNVSVVSTVKTNLTRFIKYKARQIANLR